MKLSEINEEIKALDDYDTGDVSDGWHTFAELYEHRIRLFIALCYMCNKGETGRVVWRSKTLSDGTNLSEWFLLGLGVKSGKQITYHLPERFWDACWFARTLDKAPEFDNHTPMDVLTRLVEIVDARN